MLGGWVLQIIGRCGFSHAILQAKYKAAREDRPIGPGARSMCWPLHRLTGVKVSVRACLREWKKLLADVVVSGSGSTPQASKRPTSTGATSTSNMAASK